MATCHISNTLVMELRSFNVERIWRSVVKCVLGEELGVNKENLIAHKKDIESMIDQIDMDDEGNCLLLKCNKRKDGEIWTPYLQIVEMLIRMGRKIGVITYEGSLTRFTSVHRKDVVYDFVKENLKIERDSMTGGLCSTFQYEGEEYFADLSCVMLSGMECMIFKSNNGNVTSWTELYCNYVDSVSENELIKCVVEFIKEIKYGKETK